MATPHSVAFHTLGCKLNYAESSTLSQQIQDQGFDIVDFNNGADVCVINTCSVTEFADKKCRQVVRRAKRLNPSAKIVVIGCYAQLKPTEISEIPEVDMVLGAAEKFNLVKHIANLSNISEGTLVKATEVKDANTFIEAYSFGNRTRSFLKVQDGCDYKCTFCTIPQARGKSRSGTIPTIIKTANEIVQKGGKEIVLTGVNIGDFGNGTAVIEGVKPKKEALFIDLIKSLDKEIEGIERFRISSIEPNLCTDEIISFVAESNRFVPHFHMPLQSGNNKQLRIMKRRYKKELYQDRVNSIRKVMPNACIGVDVIVGFPGETDEDFLETYNFINQLDINYLHVFTFSERNNTPAAQMEDVVPMEKRRKRNEMLTLLSKKKKKAFYQKYIGTEATILVEQGSKEGWMTGFSENYLKVELPLDESFQNKLVNVQLTELSEEGVLVGSQITS